MYEFVNSRCVLKLLNFKPARTLCFEMAGTELNVIYLLICLGETTNEGSVKEQRDAPMRNVMKMELRMPRKELRVKKRSIEGELRILRL